MLGHILGFAVLALLPALILGAMTQTIAKSSIWGFVFAILAMMGWAALVACMIFTPPKDSPIGLMMVLAAMSACLAMILGILVQRLQKREDEEKFLQSSD